MMASSDLKKAKRLLFVEDHDLFRTAFALLLEWHMDLDSVQVKSLTEARRALSSLEGEVDLEAVMNLLRNGLRMRKTGDRRSTELTAESAF